jgi:uncharacterized repeat protein (TIGR03803 family)
LLLGASLTAPAAHAAVQVQILKSFGSIPDDGAQPQAALVEGSDGALYGTTYFGGPNTNEFHSGTGTVFKLNKDGSNYSVLYSFLGPEAGDGAITRAGLVEGNEGALYGTTVAGGITDQNFPSGGGTVFKINTNGSGYALLYTFLGSDAGDGRGPFGGLVRGRDGVLYGTTRYGGTYQPPGISGNRGTVFKLDVDGSGYRVLYSFGSVASDGMYAVGLVEGSDGVLYGTTQWGGTETNQSVSTFGTVFKLNRDGSGYRVLYNFGSSVGDGLQPVAGVVEGSDGILYGTTIHDGVSGKGTVFKLNTDGSGCAVLHRFGGAPGDGRVSVGGLVEGSDGALYGTSLYGGESDKGTVFRLNKDGSAYGVLYSFGTNSVDGQQPVAGLLRGSDGAFYGTTRYGGENNKGTVFRLTVPPPPPVIQMPIQSGNQLALTWSALPGRAYQVQFKTDLTQTNWNNLGTALTATNTTAFASDILGPDPQRFYRIVLLP